MTRAAAVGHALVVARALGIGCVLAFALALGSPPGAIAQHTTVEPLSASRAAAASSRHGEAYRLLREAYDPTADDPRILAALASAAFAAGEVPQLRALLDSVVGPGPGYPHALEYWAALALEAGSSPEDVSAELDEYLAARPGDADAHEAFARVLGAHGASAAVLGLLDRAAARGSPPEALAFPRGEALRDLGDPGRAVAAYAEALLLGDERGGERIRALLAAWPAGSTPEAALEPLARAHERAEPQARSELAVLLAEADAAAGDGEGALALARADDLAPEIQARALRAVAGRARSVGDLATASRALEALLALGPPFAEPADQALLDQIDSDSDPWGGVESGPPGAAADRRLFAVSDPRLVAGDLVLAQGRGDSASAAYAALIDPRAIAMDPLALEALGRLRLVRALGLAGAGPGFLAAVGATLAEAPTDPVRAAARLDSLAVVLAVPDSAPARALLLGLAAEWRGRSGDHAGASTALERAAGAAAAEAPALLLAAGRWAAAADDLERARGLWRRVVERHGETPYALEARRLLADPGGRGR